MSDGADRQLAPADYARAAEQLGCDMAAVQTIAEVETTRSGFLPDGRPDILFEAHIFNRLTSGRFLGRMDRHGVPLAVAVWDRTLYGAGGAHQWERHDDAAALDADAADEACSWGAFQVLGQNWRMCGYSSAAHFANSMRFNAAEHLRAFINYCKGVTGLPDAIRRHDWATVARLYNGPGAVQEYGGKLAAAYNRISGSPPASAPLAPAQAPIAARAATPSPVPVHAVGDSPPERTGAG